MRHRKLKAVGVVLAAVLAISAVGANAAQAGVFEADSYPAKITGQQTSQLLFTGVVGTWKCKTVSVQGELTAESSQLNLAPIYGECSWAGVAATINMTGCTYNYTAGETIEKSSNKVEVSMDVKCPAGKLALLTLTNGCTIRIPEQTGLNTARAENTLAAEPKPAVDLTLEVTKVTYTVENGSKCPNTPADGTYSNGAFSGGIQLTAETSGGSPMGLRVT